MYIREEKCHCLCPENIIIRFTLFTSDPSLIIFQLLLSISWVSCKSATRYVYLSIEVTSLQTAEAQRNVKVETSIRNCESAMLSTNAPIALLPRLYS